MEPSPAKPPGSGPADDVKASQTSCACREFALLLSSSVVRESVLQFVDVCFCFISKYLRHMNLSWIPHGCVR